MSDRTESDFVRDITAHEMKIIRDDGVSRHIRFSRPNTRCYQFDLITWPGYLCYCGDMGTYVFQRTTDMFEFFRRSDKSYRIDYRYWAEKCEAADTNGRGIKQFSYKKFEEHIKDWIDQAEAGDKPDDDEPEELAKHATAYAELRAEVEIEVLINEDWGTRCHDAAYEFSHDGDAWQERYGPNSRFTFDDLSDGFSCCTEEYTHSFIWCCNALAWGIAKYDEAKPATEKECA